MLKEEYRERLYRNYVSRVDPGREKITRAEIERTFTIWDRHFKGHLPRDREAEIIDIGCGTGGFVYYLHRSGYGRAVGIDVSRDQVEASRNLGIPGISRDDFLAHLAARPGNYDAVIARDVLEHFSKEEVIELLLLIRKALREDGVCLIQTLNAASPFWPRYRYGDLTHEMSFTDSSVRSALLLAGFREAASFPAPPVFRHSLKSAFRVALWKLVELAWRAALLAESGSTGGIVTGNLITVARR